MLPLRYPQATGSRWPIEVASWPVLNSRCALIYQGEEDKAEASTRFEMLQATFLAWSLWVVVPISQASEKYAIANMLLSRSFAFAAS